MKNKRGEMTTQQIVILIILIASFAVILYFIFSFNFGKNTDAELCHNSVVTRGNSILPADSVPLQCQRNYICFSNTRNCDSRNAIGVEVIKVNSKAELFREMGENLATCWWMMGEGQVEYVEKELISSTHCTICSQVYFDESLRKINGLENGIDREDFFNYLENNQYSNSQTYSEYLYNTEDFTPEDVEFGNIDFEEVYFSLVGLPSETNTAAWVAIGVGALVISPFVLGAGTVTILVLGAGGGAAGYFVAPVVETNFGSGKMISASIVEANSEEYVALECETINSKV